MQSAKRKAQGARLPLTRELSSVSETEGEKNRVQGKLRLTCRGSGSDRLIASLDQLDFLGESPPDSLHPRKTGTI